MMRFLSLGVTMLFLLSFTSCVTRNASGPVSITKVNPHHFYAGSTLKTTDPMIRFEQRRYLHGAITTEDFKERYGNYFTIFWNASSSEPATVRLDYRQASTAATIHSQEVLVSAPKSRNTTKINVIGDEYQARGKVTQWKASVIQNGEVVAEYRSFQWK